MQIPKKYLLTSAARPDSKGVVYTYSATTGLLMSVEIRDELTEYGTNWIFGNLKITEPEFREWIAANKQINMVMLSVEVTFEMMWQKHNDFKRSSKKKSLAIWVKMTKENQVMAYYFHDEYERNRGNAEKKYLETYLRAELWNN